jgi:NhaA family Na+:H+ antiporter
MLAVVLVLVILNKFHIRSFIPYLFLGILLWEFTHQSGIHATIAGVLLALLIPHDKIDKSKSLLLKLEHAIAPYVAFGIMPIFAFANAGVSLEGISFGSLLNPVPLGILCGLFFGKQIGVFVFSYISVKLNFAQKPNNSNWMSLYAVSVLTGIGFTMSLFVGNLAFANTPVYLDGVKIGVLCGSLLSTLVGYFFLVISVRK